MTYEEFEKRYQYDPQRDFLARGGFGAVYKAYDTVRKRYVAIKEADVNPTHKFSLLREVEISREIEPHENIVWYENPYRFTLGRKITDYAVMPYFRFGNLNTVLARHHLTDAECRVITEGLLKGVGHLHRQGFIHRDLKASNILMDQRDGQWVPKIADFGLSKLADTEDGISNSSVGLSVAYAAPEQLRSEQLMPNVDLWAIGVALYKMVTGALPFDAPAGMSAEFYTAEVASKIRLGLPPEKAERLPQPYRDIITRCLVVDNRERAATADELLTILHAAPVPDYEQTTIMTPDALHRLAGTDPSSLPSRPSVGSGSSAQLRAASGPSTPRPDEDEHTSTGSQPYERSRENSLPSNQPPANPVAPGPARRKPVLQKAGIGVGVIVVLAAAVWAVSGVNSSDDEPQTLAVDTTALHQQAKRVIAGESKDYTRYTVLMDSLIRNTSDTGLANRYREEGVQAMLKSATILFDLDDVQQGCLIIDNAQRLAPNHPLVNTLKVERCNKAVQNQ